MEDFEVIGRENQKKKIKSSIDIFYSNTKQLWNIEE